MARASNKIYIFALKLAVSGASLFLIFRKTDIEHVTYILKNIGIPSFLAVSAIYIVSQLVSAMRWRMLMTDSFPVRKLFSLYMIGSFFSTFLPGLVGGDAIRAYYLNKNAGKISATLASVFMDRYIGFVSLMAIGIAAFPFSLGTLAGSPYAWLMPVIFVSFVVASILFFSLQLGKRFRIMTDFYDYFPLLRERKGTIASAFALSVIIQFMNFIMVTFQLLGTSVRLGAGTVKEVGATFQAAGGKKALIVTDKDLVASTDIPERIRKTLGNRCVGIFSDVESVSGIHIVNQGAKFGAGSGADCLVSVGGGSAIDTAKGMAILMKEGGRLQDYAGFQVLTRPQTPHIVIPTTAGTGSEATYIAVIKDHQEGRKLLFGDYNILPNVAILDPRMTEGLPPKLTAATGMDAMCHAIEALHSLQREPIADGLALHAIRLIKEFLPQAAGNGKDMTARRILLAIDDALSHRLAA